MKDIRELRKQARLTQREISIRLNVTQQTIQSIEKRRAKPNVLLAIELAKLLGSTVEDIWGT